MKCSRRLWLYFLGFGIGCLFVVAVFNERLSVLTSWLPGNRVKFDLKRSELRFDPLAQCQLTCLSEDTSWVSKGIEASDVRFRLSETHDNPRIYVLDWEEGDDTFRLRFALADSSTTLLEIENLNNPLNCDCP